jgi:hypothetical protein
MSIQPLLDYAISLVVQYTEPEDVEAATKALLVASLEQLFNRRIDIDNITR